MKLDASSLATFIGSLTAVVLMDLPGARVYWEFESDDSIKFVARSGPLAIDEVVYLVAVFTHTSPALLGVHKGRWIVDALRAKESEQSDARLSKESA